MVTAGPLAVRWGVRPIKEIDLESIEQTIEAKQREEILQNSIRATVFGTVVFGALTIFALILEFYSGSPYFQTYLLLCICGWASGWFIALLLTPFTNSEANVAAKIFGFIATFVSGYLLGVINPFVKTMTENAEMQSLTFKGLLFFVASFLTTLLISVIVRRYYEGDQLVAKKKDPKTTEQRDEHR